MVLFSCPPGLLYIARIIPRLVVSLLSTLIAHRVVDGKLSSHVWVLVYIFTLPTFLVVELIVQYLREVFEIRKLGARRVPQVQSYWPGGLDALMQIAKGYRVGYVDDPWVKWTQAYGPTFNVRTFGKDMMVTVEPENMKTILSTDFDNYEKGPEFRSYMQSVLGTGVFNSDGDMWKFHRGMTRPFFARDRVTDFALFDRHTNAALAQLRERSVQGEAIDFQDIMSRFTLDSATEFLFGSCVHSLAAHVPYAYNSPRRNSRSQSHPGDDFAAAFSQAQHHIALRARLTDMWPLAEFWKDKTKEPMRVINNYIDPILREALQKKSASQNSTTKAGHDSGEAETLLDHLVEQTDDHVVLRDEILNILIAGRDTTMATLTFVIYCISQNPAILARLREEILAKLGPNRRPTADDVRQLKYLRAVINETLRLYPPVPVNIRYCKKSTTWRAPDGGKPFYIPGGAPIPYSVWVMHRRADLWGPDAQEFDPDRFLDHRLHKYLTPNPFNFLPFNAGPRICLGQQWAYNEASFMLIRLLQTFDTIALTPDAQPPDSHPPTSWKLATGRQSHEKVLPKVHLTLYAYKGLWLKMGEAQYKSAA